MDTTIQSSELIDQNLLIKYSTDKNWRMDNYHFHDMFEIYYSLTDDVDFFVNDTIYPVKRGSVFVFNNMDIHRSISMDELPYERYVIHFNPEYIKDLCTSETNLLDCFTNRGPQFNHSICLSPGQMEEFIALINKTQFYTNNKVYGKEIYEKIAFVEVLLYINSLYHNNVQCCSSKSNREFQKILPILQYIQCNINENLSLDNLSKDFYINKYYLINLFKKATGFTVTEYIIQRRITKACELLKQGVPVQQVGETVGFNNNSHFIRTFKKLVGRPPKQYSQQFNR